MVLIIIFGILWGFVFKEWKDVLLCICVFVWGGIVLLVIVIIIIGYGNMFGVL